MQAKKISLTVGEIANGYTEVGFLGEDGIYGCGGRLTVCPPRQSKNDLSDFYTGGVIYSVLHGMPLGSIYFIGRDGGYEVLDGKKRLITLCRYLIKDYQCVIDKVRFHDRPAAERQKILDYPVEAYVVAGTRDEILEWLKIINAREYAVRKQEMLNGACNGKWLADAKRFFSGRNCEAYKTGRDFLSGAPENQDYLARTLSWIVDYECLGSVEEYMFAHVDDEDASGLIGYFERVIDWAYKTFPARRVEKRGVEWGLLYNRFRDLECDAYELDVEVEKLLKSDKLYNRQGVFAYVLSRNKRYLSTPFTGD